MTDQERQRHLSYTPAVDDPSLEQRDADSRLNRLRRGSIPPLRNSIDLRSRNGHDFVGPVRPRVDQGCARVVHAVVEATLRIAKDDRATALELRQAAEPASGRTWLSEGFRSFDIRGEQESVAIRAWHELHTQEAMKQWLATRGPLLSVVTVHEDFFAYSSGVYHYISGDFEGGHCVLVIGYDESGEYWLAQNTWGPTWGESGYVRIAFGERGIDASMWGVEL